MSTLASDIFAKVSPQFEQARVSQDLLFFPSTVHEHEELGAKFEIRLCPALQKKPASPQLDLSAADSTPRDPFMPPYVPNLYVGELSDDDEHTDSHVVMLNKFSVVQNHFLLITKDYKPQTSPLLPLDLVRCYELIVAAHKVGQTYFAFYNCGDLSGASQPHKHLQLIPAPSSAGPPIELLAKATYVDKPDKPFSISHLPYSNHVIRLPNDLHNLPRDDLEEALANSFIALLDLGIATVRHTPDYAAQRPSYNVIITRDHIHLIPRGREKFKLSTTGENVSVNALGYAGMLLVKSEEELEAVKAESVAKILLETGLPIIDNSRLCSTIEAGE